MKKETYFANVKTLEELKKEYRKLAVKFHPDNGGSNEAMQKLNAAYDEAFKRVKNIHVNAKGETYTKETNETPEYFRDIIEKLIKLNVTIEVIGSFIWVSGDTKRVKEELKSMGFRWHTQKLNWYLAPADYVKKSHQKFSMDEIRNMYGVQYQRDQEKAEKETERKPKQKKSTSNKYYTQVALES